MTPLLFDLCIIVLVLLSAGLGFMRGFCNEIFTIFGWIGAVLATILLTPVSRGFMRENIKSAILADLTTAAGIFIITMIIFSVISHYATKSLQDSKLNAVDRSLGFGFGILRAIILVGLAFLMVAWIWSPEDRPDIIQKAKTRPLLEMTAHWVQAILPGDSTIQISDTDTPLDKVMNIDNDEKEDTSEEPSKPDSVKSDKKKPTESPSDDAE
jgi:membrane protein required for colicin V production